MWSHAFATEQKVERLGRRDENVGRPAYHPGPLVLRGITGSNGDLDFSQLVIGPLLDSVEGFEQILVDVVTERLEWTDVEDLNALFEFIALCAAVQAIDGR